MLVLCGQLVLLFIKFLHAFAVLVKDLLSSLEELFLDAKDFDLKLPFELASIGGPEDVVIDLQFLELLDRFLSSDFLAERLEVILWLTIALFLLLFGLVLFQLIFVISRGNSWILGFADAVLGLLNPVLNGIEQLFLTVVVNEEVVELEAGQRVLWDGSDEVRNDVLILDKLLDLSSGLLWSDELELGLLVRVRGDHELDSLLIEFVFELVVFIELRLVEDVQVETELADQVGLVLCEHLEILGQVHSVEPFSDGHLGNASLVLQELLVVFQGFLAAVSVFQEVTLQLGHGNLALWK